ncbi:hypothetical protein SDC9_23241 [bioreactor metagenome]|uniref:Reductive dehalogenase domain-containing protein n=1 Tax=bioreactor metagenome TaxID=1076179 RepID=A0A644UEI0_9ZZZZ|nr:MULTISPECIES: reductive dehalogenase domain-containing protein [Dehalococcoides]MEA4878603.1 reductive dehalogenase domain-containing protein [Dehalococcoides mccartyi]POZ59157.1 Tetrachloroethene reductive dehalogenase TceA [Dehalococcoides mccartyi]QIM56905.1 reductive dehalogenase A [uncultured bacterium]
MSGYKTDYVFPAAGTCCGSFSVYWTGQKGVATPESMGVPKWSGTPEENTQMVRAAMRFFGATDVSVGELNERTKKFVSTYPQGGDVKYLDNWPPPDTYIKKIVFEDVDQGYSTDTKYVIPNKPLYCITYSLKCSSRFPELPFQYNKRASLFLHCKSRNWLWGKYARPDSCAEPSFSRSYSCSRR